MFVTLNRLPLLVVLLALLGVSGCHRWTRVQVKVANQAGPLLDAKVRMLSGSKSTCTDPPHDGVTTSGLLSSRDGQVEFNTPYCGLATFIAAAKGYRSKRLEIDTCRGRKGKARMVHLVLTARKRIVPSAAPARVAAKFLQAVVVGDRLGANALIADGVDLTVSRRPLIQRRHVRAYDFYITAHTAGSESSVVCADVVADDGCVTPYVLTMQATAAGPRVRQLRQRACSGPNGL